MCDEKAKKRRVGVMGGTFDPIHTGHLMMAECAWDQLGLDEVLFLPAGNPPHKRRRPGGAPDADRLAMVRLAISGNAHFRLDAEEMQRGGLSYTSETLVCLRGRHPDTEFFFIIGLDSLMSFDSWRHPEIICANCSLAVAARGGIGQSEIRQRICEMQQRYGAEIYLLHSPELQIASSDLRAWQREGHSIRYLVPDPVYHYIEEKHLYEAG